MDLDGYVSLSLGVLKDWRVIAAALGSVIVWALLRRVGAVYRVGPRRSPRVVQKPGPKAPAARPRPRPVQAPIDEDEEVVE